MKATGPIHCGVHYIFHCLKSQLYVLPTAVALFKDIIIVLFKKGMAVNRKCTYSAALINKSKEGSLHVTG